MKSTKIGNPTLNRVYGGDTGLVHIADGERVEMGNWMALMLGVVMRRDAARRGQFPEHKSLCPGCYMVALYNMAVSLAEQNGQPVEELASTLAEAFYRLAHGNAPRHMEHIDVVAYSDMLEGRPPITKEDG